MGKSVKLQSLQRTLRPILRPLSRSYAFAMRQRRKLYSRDSLTQYRPSCPCIAVGNVSLGGTGKTPLTGWLLDWAENANISAVILSRGYGAKRRKAPVVVRPSTPASLAGDEPLLLARNHPKATIISYPKRIVSAEMADHTIYPDIIILDDGMQHLAIQRDADIVLLQPEDLGAQWNKVLPAGTWREGEESLSNAAAFAIKLSPEKFKELAPLAKKRLARFGVPLFSFALVPGGCWQLGNKGGDRGSVAFPDTDYLLLTGVGLPAQVVNTAVAMTGKEPAKRMDFADHHAYDQKDVSRIRAAAGVMPILCTEKDAVKLEPLYHFFQGHPIFVMKAKVSFGPALFTSSTFAEWWEQWWQEHKKKK